MAMLSLTFNSSSAFCSFSERLEYFGCFSFLITALISLFVASINVSTVWWFFRGIQNLLDGFLMSSVSSVSCVSSDVFSVMLMACGVFKMCFELYASVKVIHFFIKCFSVKGFLSWNKVFI